MTLFRVLLVAGLAWLWATPFTTSAQVPLCEFKLGFKLIADQMPDEVGACLENEHYNPLNGDSLQQTVNGLLVWRKLDNFTAFTDGYRTWVNGPFGIQQRLNTEHFDWEPIPPEVPPPIAAAPAPPAPAPVPAPTTATVSFSLDNTNFPAGQCVSARWSTTNARAVYLIGAGIDSQVLPASGDRLVCPNGSTTYTLNVVDQSGATISRSIGVNVTGSVGPNINYWADRTVMNLGECSTLRWDVSNIKEIHLRGPDVDVGVTGQGERSVCPRSTSTYRLDVTDLSSVTTSRDITITVQNANPTAVPQPTTGPQPTATPQPSPTLTPPSLPPTATNTPQPTATPPRSPTAQPSPTAPQPTATATPRPQPSATPRPQGTP